MFYSRFGRAMAVWSVLWMATPAVGVASVPKYTVVSDSKLEYLDVAACFGADVPQGLSAATDEAAELLSDVRMRGRHGVLELVPRGPYLELPAFEGANCVHYRVDLGKIGEKTWRSGRWRTRDAVVLDPGLWLWQSTNAQATDRWLIEFKLPPGYDVSAPWKRIGRSDGGVAFEVREGMRGFEARMAIGRFSVESIKLNGGQIRYALLPGEPAPDAEALRRWVTAGAHALVSAYGELPVPDVQLLVVPIGQGDEPVPWGEVQRGGGNAVHLYIDQRQPEAAFMDDWVLVHELSHLLHPFVDSRDRWLPEGIASYYQNVLRARAGLKTPQDAWERLHAGFERGIRGTPRGRSLAEVSETMMYDGSFMRVYWSGAAVALLADVELRRRSDGAQSLDTALAALHQCCLPSERSWTARELMSKLDQLTDSTVFMDLYRDHVDSDEFPDLGGVYARLGLQPISATRLRLDPSASDAAICAAIMAAPEG